MRPRVFRDPVHRNLEFSRVDPWDLLAIDLIATPQLQRLRRIRQLGLASMVYHGAEHSRFVHSLGVAHLAKRIYLTAMRNVGAKPDERELMTVVAAAILHDTGHPPFSHAVEKELGVKHERVTVHLLESDTEVRSALLKYGDDSFIRAIAGHIDGSIDSATVDLVSSQLDADRLDYVLRDGYYAGVPNAQYDLERIVQMVQRDDDGFCFDGRAQFAMEGYFTARYHLYLQLYYHRTVRAAETMLRSVVRRAADLAGDGADLGPIHPSLLELLATRNAQVAVHTTDADLWSAFSVWAVQSKDNVLSDLSRRLLDRDLFRAIEIDAMGESKFYEVQLPMARSIAEKHGFNPKYYVAADTTRDTPYKLADYDASQSVRVLDKVGASHRLETLSGLIAALQKEAYSKIRCCMPAEIRELVRKAWENGSKP